MNKFIKGCHYVTHNGGFKTIIECTGDSDNSNTFPGKVIWTNNNNEEKGAQSNNWACVAFELQTKEEKTDVVIKSFDKLTTNHINFICSLDKDYLDRIRKKFGLMYYNQIHTVFQHFVNDKIESGQFESFIENLLESDFHDKKERQEHGIRQ